MAKISSKTLSLFSLVSLIITGCIITHEPDYETESRKALSETMEIMKAASELKLPGQEEYEEKRNRPIRPEDIIDKSSLVSKQGQELIILNKGTVSDPASNASVKDTILPGEVHLWTKNIQSKYKTQVVLWGENDVDLYIFNENGEQVASTAPAVNKDDVGFTFLDATTSDDFWVKFGFAVVNQGESNILYAIQYNEPAVALSLQ